MIRLVVALVRIHVVSLVAAVSMTGFAALGQTGAISPSRTATETAAKQEPPPGGCMPIGVTASGEVVFPFMCKDFIEQYRASGEKPVTAKEANQRPAEEKVSQKPPEEKASQKPAEEKPDQKPAEEKKDSPVSQGLASSTDEKASDQQPLPQPLLKPVLPPENPKKKGRETDRGPPGCTHFRSYDPASATYLNNQGRRRPCQS
jgi:BA14K-like protein